MIGLFTHSRHSEIVDFVKSVTTSSFPGVELKVVDLGQGAGPFAYRSYARDIASMDACVIDADVGAMMEYALEFGSLAIGMQYFIGDGWGGDERLIGDLDRRILLLTRKSREDHELVFEYFDRYPILSLRDTPQSDQAGVLARWLKDTIASGLAKVFVSYRSGQREFATRVARSLRRRGAVVWFDEMSIVPGDSIPEKINRGLGWCTHLVLIVDEQFFSSEWTRAEYEAVLYRRLSGRMRRTANRAIIPLYLVNPAAAALPPMLQNIRGIDCRDLKFSSAMSQLWNAISRVTE